jgi:hypothetical protein
MNKTIALVLGFVTVGILVTLPANAQEDPMTSVLLESRYMSEVDADNLPGSLSMSVSKFSFEHEFKVEERLPVTFSIVNSHTEINSDVPVYLPSNLVSRSLGLGVKLPAPFTSSPNYYIGIDVFPSMNTDGWSESSSSAFRVPFRSYLIYKRDENLIVFGGVSIRPGYAYATALPIFGFIYKPSEELEFKFASDNPTVTYQFTEKTRGILEATLVNEEYEVEYEGQQGRVLLYREFGLGAGIEHQFTNNLKGLVSVGSVLGRLFEYEDDQGEIEPEAGMYVKARLTVDF